MTALFRFFLELTLLRRAPQELPGSPWLMQFLILLNLLLNTLLGLAVFASPLKSLGAAALELVLSAALLFAALQVRGKAARWLQAYTGLLGIGAVLGLFGLGYRLVAQVVGISALADILDLVVFFWNILAMGHVLRHALDIALPLAIVIVFAYTIFLFGLVVQWLAPELTASSP